MSRFGERYPGMCCGNCKEGALVHCGVKDYPLAGRVILFVCEECGHSLTRTEKYLDAQQQKREQAKQKKAEKEQQRQQKADDEK